MSFFRLGIGRSVRTPKGAEPATPPWHRAAIVCAGVTAFVVLAPLLVLARFNAWVADDYCYAIGVRASGFLVSQWLYYMNTFGRYAAQALISLNPIVLSSRFLWFVHVFPV